MKCARDIQVVRLFAYLSLSVEDHTKRADRPCPDLVPLHRVPLSINDYWKVVKIIYVILSCLSVEHFSQNVYYILRYALNGVDRYARAKYR